ncbi:acyl-CoA carboxylase subunit beta [Streptomyces xanthophaeus]|uniref:acyl-CoA carboxylase subunit beta n=1 Tax=Streptomyces xanthophaeus TaxID=67385 RepID=UPI0004CD8623|nr:carboxyl transferase domain-containing protein [Streptomyces xanthophaeus]
MNHLTRALAGAADAYGRVAELQAIREQARNGPSARATEAQHAKGKLTARERIELLLDEDSFQEVEQLRRHQATGFGLEDKKHYTDGVITGWGTVEGRTVFVYAHDFRIFGGALGEAHATKIHKIMDKAIAAGAPLVSLNDGAGARIQEGVSALAGYGGIFQRNTKASGVIPQISVMLGPCAGGAAYSPALTDFVFMVRDTSQMFITGPDVVRAVTGEDITQNGLGGADVHAETSGVAHFAYDDEETCIAEVRMNGQVVAIVANQPGHLAGVLDIHASEKAARFVQLCDAFNIPIITLLDVPGFLPGVDQEHGGIIRHGAKLLYAYCNATVRARMVKEYKAELMHPYYAAERGLVDDVIDPAETRATLVRALAMLRNKHAEIPSRKHGNPPQ